MQTLETLKVGIAACRLCTARFGHEPQPVVFGCADAPIMQISQAPSKTVHQTGKPFNDASGRRLRGAWYGIADEVFYNPHNFYITSVGHCWPGKAKGGGDRPPPKICAETWLQREMDAVHNKLYVVIGRYAADVLFGKQPFVQLVFNSQTLRGKPAFVLPHPSPLNVKWFVDHPTFETQRMPQTARAVRQALGLE